MTDRDAESRITFDRDTIRTWADEHDARPVRRSDDDTSELRLATERERDEHHEHVDWDEFHEAMERDDKVVMFHETESGRSFDVVDRDQAISQSSLSRDELEESLLEGETVSTEVTETTVVEETIVEHADIESELLDRQTVSEEVVDAELVSREFGECNVTGLDEHSPDYDHEMFERGHKAEVALTVDVEARERWSVTKEVVEQIAIESRVTDTDVETTESIEADTVETRVALDDVEETILKSGILDSTDVDTGAIDRKSIQSDFTDDDEIITELMERKTIEEELSLTRVFEGTLNDCKTTEVETGHRTIVESEMAKADEYELDELDVDAYDRDERITSESVRVIPEDHDQGKTVVDSEGDEVGIVTEVRAGQIYVDPHPSITDKIKATLDWGDMDEDSYPLDEDQIANITGTEVRLRGNR